ncbi:hypothetical protein QQM39_26960 [Streptomyces sp. DT2A-34]|nr:hypothetical protein [Streptomyces sp. DT2A-34]MDO0914338.1 hypothetical protein [Streptomyces sp. DT2A-34]
MAAEKTETTQELNEWVTQELSKLLPTISEDSWAEVWTVIGPQAT